MMRNVIRQPKFAPDEEIILYSQGGFKNPMTSGWKLGHHYLTNKRLLFHQPSSIAYETPLSNIINVAVERQKFIMKTKELICLTYKSARTGRPVKAWIIMGDLEGWRKKISELVLIDENTIEKVTQNLDMPCSEMLWYLWEHKHAPIDELANLVDAPSHMDVLLKIRGIINPVAERTIGSPILSFERSRIDYETGEKVLFNWWLSGQRQRAGEKEEKREEALVDVFDEGDHLTVVMELVGVEEEDIRLQLVENTLIVSVDNTYREEIPLPVAVTAQQHTLKFNNNILEVRLEKV